MTANPCHREHNGGMRPLSVIAALLMAAAAASCTGAEPPVFGEPRPMHLPSGMDATGPRLASGADGTILLSWMHREKKGATLRY